MTIPNPNIRHARANMVLAAIMSEIAACIDLPREVRRELSERLYGFLFTNGAELITDRTRELYGLPPRAQDGWTIEELQAMDAKRLEAIMRPIVPVEIK